MVLLWRYGPLLLNGGLFCGDVYLLQCVAVCCSVLQRVAARCQCLFMPCIVCIHTYTHFRKKGLQVHKRGLHLCSQKRPTSLSLRRIPLPHGPHHLREEERERGRDRVCWAGTVWVGVREAAGSTPP